MSNFHKPFTNEEIEQAKNIDILEYLSSKGYSFKKAGTGYLLNPHSSFMIFPNTNSWFYYKENTGGDLIRFLEYYENKNFTEAMLELIGETTTEKRTFTKYVPIVEEKGEIILPASNKDNKRAYSYLTKTRGIDSQIVNELLKSGDIYENDKCGVVFVSKDKENKIKFACVRSTNPNSSFRQDVKNSTKEYGFKTIGKSDKLFVFEAPIDLLSHATISKMQGKDWKEDNRIALGGVSDRALSKFLEDNNHIKEIILFLDNDETGIENAKKIAKKYGNDYNVKIFTSSKGKDLNETLITYKNEKIVDDKLKIKDFIKGIKLPFITPKILNEDTIFNILKEKTTYDFDICIDNLKKDKLLAKTQNNDTIFFIKNDTGENIGGFKFNLCTDDYSLKLIKGSEQNYCFNPKANENIKVNDMCLVFTDNPIVYTFFNYTIEKFDCVLIENLKDIDTIKNIKNIDFKNYSSIGIMNGNKETYNFLKNENILNDLKSTLNVTTLWNEDFSDGLNSILTPVKTQPNKEIEKDKKKSLSQKIEAKKQQAKQINLLNDKNKKVNINISLK